VANLRIDDAGLRERIDAAVGKGGAHDGEVLCGDVERALSSVQVGGLGRVAVEPPETLQTAAQCLVPVIRLRGGTIDVVV